MCLVWPWPGTGWYVMEGEGRSERNKHTIRRPQARPNTEPKIRKKEKKEIQEIKEREIKQQNQQNPSPSNYIPVPWSSMGFLLYFYFSLFITFFQWNINYLWKIGTKTRQTRKGGMSAISQCTREDNAYTLRNQHSPWRPFLLAGCCCFEVNDVHFFGYWIPNNKNQKIKRKLNINKYKINNLFSNPL